LIVLQWLQFQISLFLPSFASFISATATCLLQNEGHLTYKCDEAAALAPASLAMFWCGSGSGSSQHALSLQMLTCCCKQLLFTGF
jgi:hypothetical protein